MKNDSFFSFWNERFNLRLCWFSAFGQYFNVKTNIKSAFKFDSLNSQKPGLSKKTAFSTSLPIKNDQHF